ncbi:MAG: M50 family metallopeptidase [Proteobacteria bacterium]|nr:M50 family metallopeptidase [Pseudomonadota bacterium]
MNAIYLFSFKGIPVSFHPMFLLLIVILSINADSPIIFGICAILGVLFHEFGHALVAQHYRLDPQILLHGMGGITMHARSANAKQDFRITFAGPLAGLIIGGALCLLMYFCGAQILALNGYLFIFLRYLGWVNLAWGIFNLLPVRPMDGSKVLTYCLGKFLKPKRVLQVSSIISILFALAILAYSCLSKSIFMIIISAYLIYISFTMLKEAFSSKALGGFPMPKASLAAESAYERGLVAAREHDWSSLETYGHQMKKNATDDDQTQRAYEFLTIACTNMGKYEEALDYSKHAKQSDAVKQAVTRCYSMLTR